MKNKINSSISIIISVIISITLLAGCNKQEAVVMPEIVFVAVNHFATDKKIIDGEYVDAEPYIKTKGYFINNNGEIKHFEFEDETFFKKIELEDMSISMDKYCTNRNLYSFHQKISNNHSDTDYEVVSKAKLIDYYRTLNKISNDKELVLEKSPINIVTGLTIFYGVRINENNEEELVLIKEGGDLYYESDDSDAEKIYEVLNDIFPNLI